MDQITICDLKEKPTKNDYLTFQLQASLLIFLAPFSFQTTNSRKPCCQPQNTQLFPLKQL